MTDQRKAHYRATRTTPDPYPPHPVLVFTDKSEADVKRASCLSVKDRDGNMENAFGSELSDLIDLTVPRFVATLNPSGEECLIWTDLLLAELEILAPTECVEIQHRSGEGPKQMVPRGQLDGLAEATPMHVEDIVGPDDLGRLNAGTGFATPSVAATRTARRRFGRSS